jgi:5-methylcytosine-specific restriction endonuclease McrA
MCLAYYTKKKNSHNKRLKKKHYKEFESFSCCYCDVVLPIDKLTIEHIIPQAFFINGMDSNFDDNIDLACFNCNQKASTRIGRILECYRFKLYKDPIIEIKGIDEYCE